MPRTNIRQVLLTLGLILLALLGTAQAASIIGSKHDLSWAASQTGDHGFGLENYNEVCVYCHTPHGANTNIAAPLWNKNFTTSAASYTLYTSATLDAGPASPPGAVSLLCLNCHDGTTGASAVRNPPNQGWTNTVGFVGHAKMDPTVNFGYCGACHTPGGFYGTPPLTDYSKTYLSTDLSDDHPIGISFPTAAKDNEFNLPPSLINGWNDVPLIGGKIECTTCHDVHNPQNVPFLNISNSGSALCTRCHKK